MAKAKYGVGDILTWCDDGDCYVTAVIVRRYTKDIYIEGISLERQTDYDMFIKPKGDDFRFIREVPEVVFLNYKVVGHIDISGMPDDTVKNNLIDATGHEFCEERIPYVILAYWNIMKMNEKNCCYDRRDELEKENRRLKEECKQKQKHLDLANNKIFELKKEVDSLRQTLNNDSTRIHKNLSVMGFTEDAICSIMYSEFNYMLGTE